ncbi:hypothetical protein BD413DRAFT_604146 [Trametes elegans]|nr:hypothetical protein BD413DRAFT_604146 [Trametes elegans]
MRVCSASAARILTFFSLALLSSHSFTLVNAQDTGGISLPGRPADGEGSTTEPPPSTSSVQQTTSSDTPVTSPSPSTTSPVPESTTSDPPPPSTTSTSESTSVLPETTSISLSSVQTSSVPTSSQTSSSTTSSSSSSTTSSTTSSSTSSTSSSTSASSTSTGVTLVQAASTSAPRSTTRVTHTASDTTSYAWLSPSASATNAAADGVSASKKGFFDNKGAVAGTFSAVGVVALGAVVAAVIYAKRRAARLQDEEDMTYFEKYNGANADSHDGHGGDISFGNDHTSDTQVMTHAAADAYPDRSMHYGLPTMEDYTQPAAASTEYGAYGASAAGMEFPAGTAYARAQAQQGPYQYDGYGADYSAQYQHAHYQEAYYDNSQAQDSSSHPYADPRNSPRPENQQYASAADYSHGAAR